MIATKPYRPEPGSLLSFDYDGAGTAAAWKIVKYLSGDRVEVELVIGSEEFSRRSKITPGFKIPISSLTLEPPNEMLVLALFSL